MFESGAVALSGIGVVMLAIAGWCAFIAMDQVRRFGHLVYMGPIAVFDALFCGLMGLGLVGWGLGRDVMSGLLILVVAVAVVCVTAYLVRSRLTAWLNAWRQSLNPSPRQGLNPSPKEGAP